jgi:copper oxidase (laccase) domain-containing protein
LRLAAALELRAAGIARVSLLDHCTRCRGEWLWSHRREPGRTGRNLTLLWRDSAG